MKIGDLTIDFAADAATALHVCELVVDARKRGYSQKALAAINELADIHMRMMRDFDRLEAENQRLREQLLEHA